MRVLCLNCHPDLSYFTKRGLNLEVEYKTINEKFPLQYLYDIANQEGKIVKCYTPFPENYLNKTYPNFTYSIILVGFKEEDYPLSKNTGGYSYWKLLNSGTFWATIRSDKETLYGVHEMHHLIGFIINLVFGNKTPIDFMDKTLVNGQWLPYYLNDQPENPASNYAVTWNNLKNWLPQLNAITYGYKWFKPSEIKGLKPELVKLLDQAREIAGVPLKITSGFRTPEQNALVGGVEDSSHEKGLAVDLLIKDTITGGRILSALQKVGFTRFGFYRDGHLHTDLSIDKPNPCYWVK